MTLAASAGEVDLSWTDNSTNEKGFNVWRKSATDTFWWLIGRTNADARTYQDRTVGAGEYRYRICAQGANICGTSEKVTVPPAP